MHIGPRSVNHFQSRLDTPCGVGNPEVVSQVAECSIGVGRVPDCAERKKKPDTHLSAFCVTPSVTPEADPLTCKTASPFPTLLSTDSRQERIPDGATSLACPDTPARILT
jgi:hypothetical protein